jgi:hypothetical protein
MTVTNQNYVHEEIKGRLNSGNTLLLFSSDSFTFFSIKYVNKINKICKIIILPVVLYGCETSFLIIKEEHKLRVSENRMLRRVFSPKKEEITRMEEVP